MGPRYLSSRSTGRNDVSPSGWVETIGYCCGPDRSRNGGEASASVYSPEGCWWRSSFASFWVDLWHRVCPEDGRWARILPSGWRTVNQDCAHLHVEKSDEPSPRISLSPEDDWPTKAFSSLRWCQGHRFIPNSERERRNTAAKARSVFNTGERCCQLIVRITGLAR